MTKPLAKTSPFSGTRQRLLRLHAKNPTLTRGQLAAKLGVSRKRVSKIVQEENLTLPDARKSNAQQ